MVNVYNTISPSTHSPQVQPAFRDGIELSIEKGHLLGLIGPDGAGKATCIRILATVMVPKSGSGRLAGLDVVRQAEHVST